MYSVEEADNAVIRCWPRFERNARSMYKFVFFFLFLCCLYFLSWEIPNLAACAHRLLHLWCGVLTVLFGDPMEASRQGSMRLQT